MKIIFLGTTQFSKTLLLHLLENDFYISAIFTIQSEFTIRKNEKVKNYNYADLSIIADKYKIPLYQVDNEDNKLSSYQEIIANIKPDIFLVLGWYYMIPEKIRKMAKYGACGIHASLLPKYAGWAPLVWAMIEGESKTGVTFFQMDNSVDGGDIIAQKEFSIYFNDSIKEVYEKATESSKEILIETLPQLEEIVFQKQDKSKIQIYPKRAPEDGEIDLNKPAIELYNFIRAQSSPYPGAFIKTVDNKKIIIEKARIEE